MFERSESYKNRQEDFVANITGTTPLEVFGLSMSVVLVPLVEVVLKRSLFGRLWNDSGRVGMALEVFLRTMFYFLIQTSMILNYPIIGKSFSWNLVLLWLCMMVVIYLGNTMGLFQPVPTEKTKQTDNKHVPFISEYRYSMQFSTIMAILMVDFQIFPRRLAKAETFGYSLMDLGVGSFVFSGAIVSNASRRALQGVSPPKLTLSKFIHSLLPLTVLAFFRFVFVKTLSYQSHVSEYGIHWNFFTTLAFLYLFSTIIDAINLTRNWKTTLVTSLICILLQQVLLSNFGLQETIFHAERSNFLLANKEGFGTLLGYLSIHLVGVCFGQFTFTYYSSLRFYLKSSAILSVGLVLLSFLPFYMLGGQQAILPPTGSIYNTYSYQINSSFFQENNTWFSILIPSRRMTNFGYIVWVASFNVTLIVLFVLVSQILKPISYNSMLRDAMNFNPLFSFLFSNIMTGLINLTMQTLDANWMKSSLIILTYGGVSSIVALILFHRKRKVF